MRCGATSLGAFLFTAAAAALAAEGELRVVEPAAGAIVSGIVSLRAEVDPAFAPRVRRLEFRVDGQPVCARQAPPFACEWDAGRVPAVHVVRAAAELEGGGRLVASVRTGARPRPRARNLLRVEGGVDVVQVVATVTDDKGRFVPGLPLQDFRLHEDGVPQELSHLIGQGTPRELVVAVDMSNSLDPFMDRVRRSVRSFLASLRPDDHVTLLAFNDSVFTLARRESDPGARERAVERLRSWGGTALYDALVRSMDLLGRTTGRRAVVLFTDGDDRSSLATLADVERRAETNESPIYVVAQGRGTREPGLRALLERLASVSGGRAFHTDDPEELGKVFAEIVDELENQYLLGYQPARAARDGTWRTIRVEVKGKGREVRARQGYRAVRRDQDGE